MTRPWARSGKPGSYNEIGPAIWTLTELIEAAARSGEPQPAGHALELHVEKTHASGTNWALGIEAFTGRAERELLATGERVRKCTVETRDVLTAQEAQIGRLARDGLSNAEIGARLFISQHKVANHLRKIFNKLGITSRSELGRVLPDSSNAAAAAQSSPKSNGRRAKRNMQRDGRGWSKPPTPARQITGWRR